MTIIDINVKLENNAIAEVITVEVYLFGFLVKKEWTGFETTEDIRKNGAD